MFEIKQYTQEYKSDWDTFIQNSKNATFLFYRNFMDYHKSRFNDYSLLFYQNNKLIALFPANIYDNRTVVSHGGLTYGSILVGEKMNSTKMLAIFEIFITFLKDNNIKTLQYKAIPFFYHKLPAQEDLYFLFLNNATLSRRDISTIIDLEDCHIEGNRRRGHINAQKRGIILEKSNDFNLFFEMSNRRLSEKYNQNAVHTALEMELLANNFPKNISMFFAKYESEVLGGMILFYDKKTIHAQYITTTENGRILRVLDFMIIEFLNSYSSGFKWFDFGISTENNGQYLNEALIKSKEEFGGNGVCYDTYTITFDCND